MTRNTPRLCFIGFGEAGQTISRGLLGEGQPAIRAYDIQTVSQRVTS